MKAPTYLRRLLNRLLAHIGRLVLTHPAKFASGQAGGMTPGHPMSPESASVTAKTSLRSLGSPKPLESMPPAPAVSAAAERAKPMRSLEEVRTDLARLRATSRERHAPVPIKRQTTFDASVFADFDDAAFPRSTDPREEYAKTVCLPRTASKARSRR